MSCMIILWTSIINMSKKKGPAVHGPFSVRLPQCWRVRALVVVKGVLCFWRTGVVFYPSNLPVKAERSLFLSLSNNHLVNVSALMQSVDFILQYWSPLQWSAFLCVYQFTFIKMNAPEVSQVLRQSQVPNLHFKVPGFYPMNSSTC